VFVFGVGDPCTPEEEYDPSFTGFDPKEVNVESRSFQCQTRLCLVNHFQGRVTCPYGQSVTGAPPPMVPSCSTGANAGTSAGCCIPGIGVPVTGKGTNNQYLNSTTQAAVAAQCVDRTADNAVYCSCRCENVNGLTNDGANYCTCPTGFSCTQLVSSIGTDEGLTGGYCVKNNTTYDPNNACEETCDPTAPTSSTEYCGSPTGAL
jgi:hypothetical protein